jgi:molybdopterin converting factor small subunit
MFESPVLSVHIPLALRNLAGNHAEIIASGDTVGEVLEAISHEYLAIRSHLISGSGELQPGLAVFLGARSIGDLDGLATAIEQEEVLSIVATGAH